MMKCDDHRFGRSNDQLHNRFMRRHFEILKISAHGHWDEGLISTCTPLWISIKICQMLTLFDIDDVVLTIFHFIL